MTDHELIVASARIFFVVLFVLAWSITDVVIEIEEYKELKKNYKQ